MSGFQYVVGYESLEKKFNIRMTMEIANKILELLWRSEEVADVELDDYGFDVVLYTAYAPNYVGQEEQD